MSKIEDSNLLRKLYLILRSIKMTKKKPTILTKLTSLALLTTIIFLILKLTDVIFWQWIWVLSPFWGVLGLNLIIALIKDIVKDIKEH